MQFFDETKKSAPVSLGRVLVLGLGASGAAVGRYCARLLGSRVDSLTIAAGTDNDKARDVARDLEQAGATVLFETYRFDGAFDVCIASPGISENSEFFRTAACCSEEVISEVEFAWRESAADSTWIAITGTNGKTTTTALAAHILVANGRQAKAVGNIGDTCIEAVASGQVDTYVAEVSSYQLASTRRFKPEVAVLLNITPDHLKWHGSLEAYASAKRKVYANCDGSCAVVMDATNEMVRSFVREAREQGAFPYVPLGCARGLDSSMREACGSENAAYLDGGRLVVEWKGARHDLVAERDLMIKGEHNAANALAAASVAVALGIDDDGIRRALTSFAPLEHRIEPCGSVAGVACYNDSKATNVDATLKALAAFDPDRPIVLLGGDDKGTDLSELVDAARAHCKAVVCFGASRDRFLAAFERADDLAVFSALHLRDALEVALDQARSGDIVVLSPACASFDEFSCFEERGETFKALVAQERSKRGA